MNMQDILNDRQREAVLQAQGPVLILAGAGSGKTRVLIHRIAYLIEEKGVNPFNIMAITFTNKAAGEMRDRVDRMVGFGSESIWVATFHSTCVRILRRYIDRIGYDTNFTIYDSDDQKALIRDICKRLQIDTKMYKERSLLSAIGSAKDELVTPQEFTLNASGDYGRQKVAQVYAEYQRSLRSNNALDFDDLICKTVELFQSCPDVLDYYQDRFLYIMVDEYQDTNTAQFELVRLLAKKNRNLCVVGDDDQSIYKFRGANIRNILDFEKTYPDAVVVKLEQNYRSTQGILSAANAVISNNVGRKEKALWTDQGEGNKLHFKQFDYAQEEAEYIVGDIRSKVREEGVNYKDCAVLYRTNAQSRLLEEQFVISGIPYHVVGGVNFYARKEIKDLLSYLKTIDNGRDDLAVRRIINVPRRGIGAATMGRVQEYAMEKGISFYDALREAEEIKTLGRSAAKLAPFVTMIQVFRSKLEYLTLTELMNDVIETTGYIEDLKNSDEEDTEDRIANIQELLDKITAFEEASDEKPTLSEFLEEVALVADVDSVEDSDNRVLLMTLHSAKGLEFPHVYMAGMEDGMFPSYMSILSDDHSDLEEERRLCYVGITRAMEDLTLTCAKQRMVRGETLYNAVSRFVKEIPGELLDNRPLKTKKRAEDMPDPVTFSEARANFRAGAYGLTKPSGTLYSTAGSTPAAGTPYSAAGLTPAAGKPYSAAGTVRARRAAAIVPGMRTGTPVLDRLDYEEGDRVSHVKFGEGTVSKIVRGGRDFEVTVSFDTAGVKKMFASFAKLKKI